VQHFTRFQLTVCSHGSSALAALFVLQRRGYFGRICSKYMNSTFGRKLSPKLNSATPIF